MTITEADIERWFTYHPPTDEQRAAYKRIREVAKAAMIAMVRHPGSEAARRALETLDETVIDLCPDGPEKTEALGCVHIAGHAEVDGQPTEMVREIRAAVMWANAAIACAPANLSKISNGSTDVSPPRRRCPCGAPIYLGEICNCGRDYEGSTE